MKITKQDFFRAIHQLGPHACMEFVLNDTDDIYKWLNDEIELDKLSNGSQQMFELPALHVNIIAKRFSRNTVYAEIIKKPEGFLGYF